MPSPINKKLLKHLSGLARIELNAREEEKLLADLQKIVRHFEELQTLDTENVPPMAGGTSLQNVFREDAERTNTDRGEGVEAFPESEDGFLKTPPVFE